MFNDSATFAGADASGNVLLATLFRDEDGDDQFAVHERCGSGPAWQRTVLTDVEDELFPGGLKVGADGTAMALWEVGGTHYSRVRAPGGAWGPAQVVVSGADTSLVRFALSDHGAAIAVWADATGTRAAVRPAGGAWGAPELVTNTTRRWNMAMSPSGAAVVVYQGTTPGSVFSRYRSAGGAWTAQAEVMNSDVYPDSLDTLAVEFDGSERAVAVADFREFNDTIRWNAGTAGAWGADKALRIDDDGDPPAVQYDLRGLEDIARHPGGVVAAWTRKATSSNPNTEIVVGRLAGAAWDLKVFKIAGAVFDPQLAVNGAGEILLAVDSDQNDIRAAIAPSLGAAWPDLALVSLAGSAAQQFREPFATSGGSAFAVGWGVHGPGHQRTEVVATKACGGAATPTPTPTATVDSPPQPGPTPIPTPPAPPAEPKAPVAADYATLPSTAKCVRRGGKLTVRFKTPAGVKVKSVTVKLKRRTVATLKGKALRRPYYLRKLPRRGTFTVTVAVRLATGKSLTERRRYTVCR